MSILSSRNVSPALDVKPREVIKTIERGIREAGYNEFSLLSLSYSDYLALPGVGIELKNQLQRYNITLSLPSQRVDRFDKDIANIVGGNRKSGLNFAPKAETQRMRDVINKGLTFELTETLNINHFCSILQNNLPKNLPLYSIGEIKTNSKSTT